MCLRSLSCCRTHGLYSLRSRANGRTLTFRVFWSTAEFFVLFPVGMILTHLPKRSLFHMGHDGFLYHEHLHLKSAFCLYLIHLRVTNMQKKGRTEEGKHFFKPLNISNMNPSHSLVTLGSLHVWSAPTATVPLSTRLAFRTSHITLAP